MAKPQTPIPDSTIARMAGNIAAGLVTGFEPYQALDVADQIANASITIAKAIVAQLARERAEMPNGKP